MLSEVLEHFGFTRDLHAAGYYETSYHRQFLKNLRSAIHSGNLIAFTGLVGSGKTLLLRQLQDELLAEKRITVAKSLAVDKDRASLTTLITALFYDLSPDKEPKIPSQSEHRERALRELVRKSKRPVVLFIDDAHDLHHKTLVGLKRLREVVADGGGVLSIVLAGHPKLRNVLLRPNMEEIGFRFAVFPFEGMAGYQADYIAWLLGRCLKESTDQAGIIESGAVDLLATRLRTPLQINDTCPWRSRRRSVLARRRSQRRSSRRCCRGRSTTSSRGSPATGMTSRASPRSSVPSLPRSACSCRASSPQRARAN
jgi:type II secretory pathway predicted ATPase ExeA